MARTADTVTPLELISSGDAARIASVSQRTIQRMAADGSIPAVRVGGRIKIDGARFAAALAEAFERQDAEDAATEAHNRAQGILHAKLRDPSTPEFQAEKARYDAAFAAFEAKRGGRSSDKPLTMPHTL